MLYTHTHIYGYLCTLVYINMDKHLYFLNTKCCLLCVWMLHTLLEQDGPIKVYEVISTKEKPPAVWYLMEKY